MNIQFDWNIGDKVSDKVQDPEYIYRGSIHCGSLRTKKLIIVKETDKIIKVAGVRNEVVDGVECEIFYDADYSINKTKLGKLNAGIMYDQIVVYARVETEFQALVNEALESELCRIDSKISELQSFRKDVQELVDSRKPG